MKQAPLSHIIFLVGLLVFFCCTRQFPLQDNSSEFGTYADSISVDSMTLYLHQLMTADTSRHKADKAVIAFYNAPSFSFQQPLWFNDMGVSPDADSLLSFLRRQLPLAALDTTSFFLPQIAADLAIVHGLWFDSIGQSVNEVLPRLEYHLSKAFVRYCTGQRYGFIRPDQLFNHLEFKSGSENKNEYAQLFDYEVESPDYEESVVELSSPDRMLYLQASQPHGPVYEALAQQMLHATNNTERLTLAVNMERCRWQHRRFYDDSAKVLVNIPAQQLWAVNPDSVLNMRICCGAVTNKTPLLCSTITHMQINPDWIVPQNIVKSDFVRHAGDSAYFARNRYYIVDKSSGDTLRVEDVDAEDMRSNTLRIGQKGGAGNSLGRIVFRFMNNFGVYLHDTNNQRAFTYAKRTLSHGCIRLEKPYELACFLLPQADEWTIDCLRLSIDMTPLTPRGKKYLKEHPNERRPLRLLTYHNISPRVPVYLLYFTAWPNPSTGELEFYPDLYGYDKAILNSLAYILN